MGVILRETAHARHAAQLSALFPTVHRAEFRQPHGKVPVGVGVIRVNLDVVGAVHRLEHIALNGAGGQAVEQFRAGSPLLAEFFHGVPFRDGRVLAFLVIREVSGRAVQVQLADVGRVHLGVAQLVQLFRDEVLQGTADESPLGLPEDEPLPHGFVNAEQAQFAAQFAVVAAPRLFQPFQVFVKLGAVREAGAVNALEHGAVFVPLVEGARHAHDFECLAVARAAHVGTGAQVRKIPVAVEGNLLVFRDVVQQVNLEAGRLTAGAQGAQLPGFRHFHGIRAGNDFLLENLVFLHHFFHLLLNAFKVLCADAVVQLHVVIKTVIHGRPAGQLGIRPEAANGRSQNVRAGVAQPFQIRHLLAFFKSLSFLVFGHTRISKPLLNAVGKCKKTFFPKIQGMNAAEKPFPPASGFFFRDASFPPFRSLFPGVQGCPPCGNSRVNIPNE